MGRYVLKLLLQMVPLLIGITIISFAMMHLAPGGPMAVAVGDEEMQASLTPEQVDRIRARYGLDQPIHIQYFRWVSNMARGDFGTSFTQNRPVGTIILERLPNTLYLMFVVIVLAYLIAIPIGVWSAIRQYSVFDMSVTTLAFWGQAMPNFWLALLLIFTFAIRYPGIPTSGMATYGVDLSTSGFVEVLFDRLRHFILPVTVLTAQRTTALTRYMRSSMLDVIRLDYVRTARAKGLAERAVLYRHALKNAILPVITLAGFTLSQLFSGSVIVERIFSWPGLGNLSIQAIFQRDYAIIMAFVTIGALLTVTGMLLVDIAYAYVDPRIRFD